MNYLERLIHRALAEPREAVAGVFDPFEQTALWETAQTRRAPMEKPPAMVEPPARDAQPAEVSAVPAAPLMPPPVASPVVEPALVPGEPVPALAERVVEHVIRGPSAQALSPPPAETATAAVLARADAFMRALGAPVLMPSASAPAPVAPQEVDRPAPPHAALRPDAPPRAAPVQRSESALLRPPAPARMPVPVAMVERARSRKAHSEAASAAPSATAARRAPAASAAERIVHTTLVVAPRSRGLDELAHGSGMAHFGIGQG